MQTEAKTIQQRYVGIFAAAGFLAYLVYRILLISFPHPDAGGVENNVIWFIQRLLDGDHLYSNPELPPYSIAQYTPAYYYLCAGIAKIAGIGPDDVLSLFALSRAVSLLLNILYIVVVFATARRIFRASFIAASMAAVFAFMFLEITSYSRPDSLNHLFFLSSFYCFACFLQKNNSGRSYWIAFMLSAVLAAAAVFSKQSSVILPLICVVWFVRKKQMRLLLYWLLSFLLTVAIFLFIINSESGLNPFLQNTVAGINNGVSFYWYCHTIVKEFYAQFGLLWIPAFIFLLFTLSNKKDDLSRFSLWCVCGSFIFSNLISLKWGSSPGYFSEWVALVFIGCAKYGSAIVNLLTGAYRHLINAVLIIIITVKTILIFYPILNMMRPGIRAAGIEKYRAEQDIANFVKQQLKDSPGHYVFNNIYSPELYLNNLLFRECVMPQFEVVAYGTWKNHMIDYSNFRKTVTDGTVKYVVNKDGSQLQFMDVPLDMFKLMNSFPGGYSIYSYKP